MKKKKKKRKLMKVKKPKGITDLSSKNINVKVVVDNSSSKEFENVSITTKNLDSGYKVQAATDSDRQVTVVVKGSEESLNNIKDSDITAYVDLKNYGEGTHEVEVKVTGTDLKLSYASKTKKVKIVITKK